MRELLRPLRPDAADPSRCASWAWRARGQPGRSFSLIREAEAVGAGHPGRLSTRTLLKQSDSPAAAHGHGHPSRPGIFVGASTLRPLSPWPPSPPPMPSRRPLRSLSGFEMVLHGFTCVRLSARLCRRYGGASGRTEQGTTGWGRGGSGCPHCVRDDYGGQRERSRIARAAVPYCPAPDVSRIVILCQAGRSVASCVRPLWWTAELSTSRQTPGSTSPIDAGRGLTGGLLRSFSRSAASAIRCSRLLPTRELKSSLYFRAGRSLPHTQTDSAPRLPDTPQTTRQPASILATVRASVSFGGQTSCPRRSPTPDYHHQQSAQAGPLKKKTRDKRAEQSD